jgi:hypothetical protein
MSAVKEAEVEKGVRFNKHTGGAYADLHEIIKSELARIRAERAAKVNGNGAICQTDQAKKSGNHSAE